MTAPQSVDPQAFRAFELAGWEHASAPYATHWGSLTRQAIGPLLDATAVGSGTELLDVACGPGWVSRAASERGARTTGVDFSPAMIAQATQTFPALAFVVGDAEDLDFSEASFDAVAINFGILHLGRPEQAIAEAFQVLRPGGRVGFTVWSSPDEAAVFGIVLRAVSAHGDASVPIPAGPPFFRYSDVDEASRLLIDAGFVNPVVSRVPQTWRIASAEAVWEAMCEGTARTGGLLRRQSAAHLAAIRSAVIADLKAYQRSEGLEIPMPAVLATAAKP